MDTETMLADLFEGRWPADRNPYALNSALRVRPWWPSLVEVWKAGEPPARMAGTALAAAWTSARKMLDELHEQYRDSKPKRTRS